MKKSVRILKDCIDAIALAVGIFSLYCILFRPFPENTVDWFCIASGIMGAGYVIYALVLYLSRRIEFDRKLLDGHFLRKVICLVVLIPFLFWLMIILLVVGLFTDFRYSFRGPNLGSDAINDTISKASDMADSFKAEVIHGDSEENSQK